MKKKIANKFFQKTSTTDPMIYWIYTETGHGKGFMDGVGSAMKTTIKDSIAYNPNATIETLRNYYHTFQMCINTLNVHVFFYLENIQLYVIYSIYIYY